MTICPEKIVNSGPLPILSSCNVANINTIVWNVHNPILLRMLVCRDERTLLTDNCPYPDHNNTKADKKVCDYVGNKLAQIYFRHKVINSRARSCVVVFIEGDSLHKTDVLLDEYQNTVKWLNIAEEKPYFHIIYFGDPLFDNDITSVYKNLDEKLKAVSPNEDLSIITYACPKVEVINVTHTTNFSVKAQVIKL